MQRSAFDAFPLTGHAQRGPIGQHHLQLLVEHQNAGLHPLHHVFIQLRQTAQFSVALGNQRDTAADLFAHKRGQQTGDKKAETEQTGVGVAGGQIVQPQDAVGGLGQQGERRQRRISHRHPLAGEQTGARRRHHLQDPETAGDPTARMQKERQGQHINRHLQVAQQGEAPQPLADR